MGNKFQSGIESSSDETVPHTPRISKFLVLGTGESGKTTFSKQLEYKFDQESFFNKSERENVIVEIYFNIYQTCIILCEFLFSINNKNESNFDKKEEINFDFKEGFNII